MNKQIYFPLFALLCIGLNGSVRADSEINNSKDGLRATHARFIPERSDDFAWENDLIAFRAYGPALRKGKENAGIDCWLKRVPYPIVDKWYYEAANEGKSYHKDHGEGLDNYHVGASAGCGGTALWIHGQREALNTFTHWKILNQSPKQTRFMLTYEREIEGALYREEKTITITLGERLFKAESIFYKDGTPTPDLAIAIGVTTHDGKAETFSDSKHGWMAAWKTLDGSDLGTAVLMKPGTVESLEVIESNTPDASHGVIITRTDDAGTIVYYAGYG